MFKIEDGRESFYQWDLNRRLIVEDAQVREVHFCNRTDSYSLVCETYVEEGVTLVNVPNILLQNDWKIHAYAYDGEYTKHEKRYDVVSRTKPADYVYTETEIKNYDELEKRVDALEFSWAGEDVVTKEYLEQELKTPVIPNTTLIFETNKVYTYTLDMATILVAPYDFEIDKSILNQMLLFLNVTANVEIIWAENIVFVNDTIPTIGIGNYRIYFEYNNNLNKWVVGVIQDGAVQE